MYVKKYLGGSVREKISGGKCPRSHLIRSYQTSASESAGASARHQPCLHRQAILSNAVPLLNAVVYQNSAWSQIIKFRVRLCVAATVGKSLAHKCLITKQHDLVLARAGKQTTMADPLA